jgi:hypothetical protein
MKVTRACAEPSVYKTLYSHIRGSFRVPDGPEIGSFREIAEAPDPVQFHPVLTRPVAIPVATTDELLVRAMTLQDCRSAQISAMGVQCC